MAKKDSNKNITINFEETTSKRPVEFIFHSSEAKSVCLAGEFNDWNIESIHMKKENKKDWKTIIDLSPGRYEYKYFVDGAWAEDIPDVERTSNAFGTQNYVIHVE